LECSWRAALAQHERAAAEATANRDRDAGKLDTGERTVHARERIEARRSIRPTDEADRIQRQPRGAGTERRNARGSA